MIIDTVNSIIDSWNNNLQKQNFPYTIELKTSTRKKKYYTTKDKFFEKEIAELLLIQKGEGSPTLLLYRKEIDSPVKVKGIPKYKIESESNEILYKYLLYEALGSFFIITQQTIVSKDYAEYDIVKERLKGSEDFKDTIIEVTENGNFYEKGDKFDVFGKTPNGIDWIVYTEHDIGKASNGLAKIEDKICKVEVPFKLDLIAP